MSAHRCGDSHCVDLFALEYLLNVLSEADAWIKGRDFLTALNLKITPRDELTFRQSAEITHKVRTPIAKPNHSHLYCHKGPSLRRLNGNSFSHFCTLSRIVVPNELHIWIFIY